MCVKSKKILKFIFLIFYLLRAILISRSMELSKKKFITSVPGLGN